MKFKSWDGVELIMRVRGWVLLNHPNRLKNRISNSSQFAFVEKVAIISNIRGDAPQ